MNKRHAAGILGGLTLIAVLLLTGLGRAQAPRELCTAANPPVAFDFTETPGMILFDYLDQDFSQISGFRVRYDGQRRWADVGVTLANDANTLPGHSTWAFPPAVARGSVEICASYSPQVAAAIPANVGR